MRVSPAITDRPIDTLRPYGFTRTHLPALTEEETARLRQSLTVFPPAAVQVPLQGLPDGRVVIGQHRLHLAGVLGLKTLPYQVIENATPDELEQWAALENSGRRALTKGQLIQLALGLKPQFEAEARTRLATGRQTGGRTGGRGRTHRSEDTASSELSRTPQTRDRLARTIGMNGRTFERGARVLQDGPPELRQQLLDGQLSPSGAYKKMLESNEHGDEHGDKTWRWSHSQLLGGLHKVVFLLEEQWPAALATIPIEDTPLVGDLLGRVRAAADRLVTLLEPRRHAVSATHARIERA